MIDQFLAHLYHQGRLEKSYKLFGAHYQKEDEIYGTRFTVYSPNAISINVIGSFNNWNETSHSLAKVSESIWTIFVPKCKQGAQYKYLITTNSGEKLYKADPYAFYSELRPATASIVYKLDGFKWSDKRYLNKRTLNFEKNLNIYELHLGSFKQNENHEFYNYEEYATNLITYVKDMGYTHIEILPLNEHPFDGSWGYQATGYFSVTSRYGHPKQLMHLINQAHRVGIGVIIDFVPAHFVKDAHGLYQFDGGCVYEYPDANQRYSEWDSVYFDLGKLEVRSFMISAIHFWIEYFHVDGIRFDAISHLIYHKGNKEAGVNEGSIDFICQMSDVIHTVAPTVMLIAEDSSDYPGVTKPIEYGGLGFHYKWDLGWMNDTLNYLKLDPIYRQHHHQLITFSMHYFYNENFILPFSHDEVVHGKGTIINKIYGDYNQKMAQLKTLQVYMMSHPGKKLNFMTNALAEFKEWDENTELGWNILDYPAHKAFHQFTKDLNQIMNQPAFYELDYNHEGFEWLVVDDCKQSVFAYIRKSSNQDIHIIILNFTGNSHEYYHIPVKNLGKYVEIINSDDQKYGGLNQVNDQIIVTNNEGYLPIKLAPFNSIVLKYLGK